MPCVSIDRELGAAVIIRGEAGWSPHSLSQPVVARAQNRLNLPLSLSQPSVKPRMIASNFSPAPARAQVPALRPARNFLMLSTCFRLSFLLSPAPFISVEPMLPVRTVYSRSRFSTVRSEKAAGPARVAYIMRCMCVCIHIHTYTLFLDARVLFFTRSVEYIVQCKGARGDFRLFGESWLKFA